MGIDDEPIYGGLIDVWFLVEIIMITATIVIVIWATVIIVNYDYSILEKYCDYDSCSQESEYWEIEGGKCFNETDTKCQDFLRLWNYCQHYKKRMGIIC